MAILRHNFRKNPKTKIQMPNLIIKTINNLIKMEVIILNKITTIKINLTPHIKNLKTPKILKITPKMTILSKSVTAVATHLTKSKIVQLNIIKMAISYLNFLKMRPTLIQKLDKWINQAFFTTVLRKYANYMKFPTMKTFQNPKNQFKMTSLLSFPIPSLI